MRASRLMLRQEQMYAPYIFRQKYYLTPAPRIKELARGVDPFLLLKPKLTQPNVWDKDKFYAEKSDDMTKRENLDAVEALRRERERDFYQDHTYHDQWIQRELNDDQKAQLTERYDYFQPGFQRSPWLWYPGDLVEVVRGAFAGQRGTIVAVVAFRNQLIVQNVNVQEISIPASESRPEQIMQREHPIHCDDVRHVDPTTGELCDLKLVTVRNKETGKPEKRRLSLASGVMLPIPAKDFTIEGDPLLDTPLQDAEEETYHEEKELAVIVQRKLRAMEDFFVSELKAGYEFHKDLFAKSAADMRQFQSDVVARAEAKAVESLSRQEGADEWLGAA